MMYAVPVFRLLLPGLLLLGGPPTQAQFLAIAKAMPSHRAQGTSAQLLQLRDVLSQLKVRYQVDILFEDRLVSDHLVSPTAIDPAASLESNLANVLKPQGLHYTKVKKGVYVVLANDKAQKVTTLTDLKGLLPTSTLSYTQPALNQVGQLSLKNQFSMAVDQTITGRVTDGVTGNGLPGVNVVMKGTSRGTTTDTDGNYRLNVPDQSVASLTLVFSFIGYATQEVGVGNRVTVNVTLASDNKTLNEIVVVGYTTQARRDITGAVSSVKAEDLQAIPATNFAQQLQGRAAGVTVNTDGAPGGGVAIRIRGIGSITGSNDPLYIIDGVPTQGGLNQLNPNDIETLQVLKDAATASVYGSRASNGVVIVTTKRGKPGEAKISISSYAGLQEFHKVPKSLTPQQYATIQWENFRNTGQVDPKTGNPVSPLYGNGATPVLPDYLIPNGAMAGDPRTDPANYSLNPSDPAYGATKFPITQTNKTGTDWFREITRTAPIQSYNLTVSGGSDKSRYALSGGYFNQEGILKFTGFKRYSIRANSEFTVKNVIRIGENLQFSYSDDVSVATRTEGSPVTGAYLTQTIAPVFDINGYYSGERQGGLVGINPYARLERNKDNHNYNGRIFGNVYAEGDLFKKLTLRTSIGLDYTDFNASQYTPPNLESITRTQVALLTINTNYGINWTWTNTLNYQSNFGQNHKVSVLAGTEAVNNKFRNASTTKSGFAFDDINYQYLDAGSKVNGASGSGSDSRLFSLFAKIDYSFLDKYLFSATIRRDGSSRFSLANRYGVFPALSAGWRISGEDFMRSVHFVDDLKLRASWGKTGNQEIDNYNQYSTYSTSLAASSYDLNGTSNSVVNGFSARRLGNPNAQWEAQTMTNLGLDATLFKGRLDVTLDAYNRQSTKLLLVVPGPATDGQVARPAVNVGSMRNRGLDVQINYRGSAVHNELKYNIGLNWSTYNNQVTQLYAGTDAFIAGYDTRLTSFSRTQVGQPVASFYGFIVDGILQTQEEANAYPTQGGNRALLNQPGRFKFRDVNGDGTVNAQDQTFIGNPNPKFTYGLNLNTSYKGVDLTVFLQGVYGNDLFNYLRYSTDFWTILGGPGVNMLDSWTPQNTGASLPKINANASPWESQASTHYLEKGSYLRAKNVQLGYTLPSQLLSRLRLDRIRVYVQANNLFTITKYTGFDSEVNVSYFGAGADRDLGVDRGIYPVAKSYMVGLQVGF